MKHPDTRPGEIVAAIDPARTADDARLIFIGRIRSPWRTRQECPRNLRQARERGLGAKLEVDEAWRAGLKDLKAGARIVVLYWMHEARRDLVVQSPKHVDGPVGVFSLRSPVRPNPIAFAAVTVTDVDADAGIVEIDAIDCLDRTPLLDIKPYLPSVDSPFDLAEGT